MAVSKRLRYEILRRDGFRCHYCGAGPKDAALTVDHVTAVALGGADTPDNLVTACEPCNSGKTSMPADAPLVAQVQEREQEFRAAITTTVEQDREKRWFAEAFVEAWDRRRGGELPPGWKRTIDAYRQSGLAPDAWDEIVEIALAKPDVDDRFRYCCGVARGKVKKIQEQAAKLAVQPAAEPADDSTRKDRAVREAAFACWYVSMGGDEEDLAEAARAFRRSLDELDQAEFIDSGRIISAAEYGGWFGLTNINQAFRDMDFHDAWRAWMDAWPRTFIPGDGSDWGGRWEGGPDDDAQSRVKTQINKLLDAGVIVSRIAHAATYAGFHKSSRLYQGLADHELEASGVYRDLSQVLELWRVARVAVEGQDPDEAEVHAFFKSVRRATTAYADDTHCLLNFDLFQAAVWAGAYQDPDITTCLPLRNSVFAAAAALPVPPLPD